MAQYPALPLWTDAYLADTRHLTAEQHGAYLLLLMEAWRRPACSLPDDDHMLARLACLPADRWEANRDTIMAFWKRDGRKKEWTQPRLLDEREFVVKKSKSQSNKAASRWKNRTKDDAAAMPHTMPDECPSDAPTPTPIIVDTNVSTLSETQDVSDQLSSKTKRVRKEYPADFEAAWIAYPTTPNMSKAEALPEWRKLSAADRNLVVPSIVGYRTFLAANPTHPTIHFVRYLSKRRFEGFSANGAMTPVTDEAWLARLGHARKNQVWSTAEWGPMPSRLGCCVPRELLEQGDGVGWSEWKSARTA